MEFLATPWKGLVNGAMITGDGVDIRLLKLTVLVGGLVAIFYFPIYWE